MSDWYVRQFGDRDAFAIMISLGRNPLSVVPPNPNECWGSLGLWVRGRCLTRSIDPESTISDAVQWDLFELISWLATVAVPLANEEPLPLAARARDACDWVDATEAPGGVLDDEAEDAWYSVRSDWRGRHSLRRAAAGVALPNVVFRRLGESIEVSWNNEAWSTSRPGLSYVERRGTELVSAREFSEAIVAATQDAARVAADHLKSPGTLALAARAQQLSLAPGDWKWLIHRETADVVAKQLEPLRSRLAEHQAAASTGIHIPHSNETLILRQTRLTSADEITALLDQANVHGANELHTELQRLTKPTRPRTSRPWVEGYEFALRLRDALGWGQLDPSPPTDRWMQARGFEVRSASLSPTIDVVALRKDKYALSLLNPDSRSALRKETGLATTLGHVLMDELDVAIDGLWEHWPTAARARAFAVMLLIPEDGLRARLRALGSINAPAVASLMTHFRTGPHSTTNHLMNLGFIDSLERMRLLSELSA
ncbi:MAG: hypothetical protein HYV07_19930 [Deltaproteobacteria bacterium]|nr:hypothetical protein [Deltaproteobacteria bacterium]